MNRNRKRSCVICGEEVRLQHALCYKCFVQYKEYMGTPWFRELAAMQKQQDFIDTMENYVISDTEIMVKQGAILRLETMPEKHNFVKRRNRGRPKTVTAQIRTKVQELRTQGLSYRKIGAIVRISHTEVKRLLEQ